MALVACAASSRAEDGYIVASKGYTVRNAPQTAAPAAGRVQVGDKVVVLSRVPGWVQVQSADVVGWIGDSWVGAEPPATLRLGPMEERIAGLEDGLKTLEAEKLRLQEENTRLVERAAGVEKDLLESRKAAATARSSGRFQDMALGGGLVIAGWLAGYALGTRRRAGRIRLE